MVLYVGETVTVKIVATDPVRGGDLITDAVATVELFAVDTDPKGDPSARAVTRTVNAAYDATAGAYLAYVTTDDLGPGKHPYRAMLTGAYDSWEYGSFTLKA